MSDTLPPLEKTIELRRPLQAGGTTVTQISLRPPRISERRLALSKIPLNGSGMADIGDKSNITLIAKVADVSEAIIEQMDLDQFEEALAYLEGFSAAGRMAGKQSASS